MVLVVLSIFVGDYPGLFRRYRMQSMVLDTAYTDELRLKADLERMLGAKVHRVSIQHVDLVNDTTAVEVRYQLLDSVVEHESLGASR